MSEVPAYPSDDLLRVLENEEPALLIEFVEQLQAALDQSLKASDKATQRVAKLERDRERLRQQLDDARAQLRRITSTMLGKAARRMASRPIIGGPKEEDQGIDEPAAEVFRPDSGPVVATILDPISDACWSPEFQNLRLDRRHWRRQLEEHQPEVLFVESAFSGHAGTWLRRIAHFGGPHHDVLALTRAANELGIPTVFWNKEDPVNYAWFVGTASVFDHVFTVDSDTVGRYERDTGNRSVRTLGFAAQPVLHHPPSSANHQRTGIAFAGTYYARKHTERRRQMDMLLEPALDYGLEIYDRMAGLEDPRFAWPSRFADRIVGSVPYPSMGDVYRRHAAFINVNTVTRSPTMCARRVYELAACGTPVISGPSRAIEEMVPPSVVTLVADVTSVRNAYVAALDGGLTSKGPEWIAQGNTYADRWRTITEVL